MNPLNFTIENHPASILCTIKLKGELKSTGAIQLKEQLCKHMKEFGRIITIDLCDVDDLDLTGLNALLISKQSFSREGKVLRLRLPDSGPLNEFAKLTKFEKFLNID